MTAPQPVGWGGASWGGMPWGGGPSANDLELDGAVAVAENVVRLTFTAAPNFTRILNPHDASSRFRYSIAVVPGTIGNDGQLVRPVFVASVAQSAVTNSQGTMLDITVDRPLSAYPAQYTITANNLYTANGIPLNPLKASAKFYGLQRERVPALTQNAVRSRDIANPFVASSLDNNLLVNTLLVAGAFSSDSGGDLALDDGVVSVKKWILRCMVTAVGGFPHDPTFGVGLVAATKQLNTAAARARIGSAARSQIARHPLISKSAVTFTTVKPGFVMLQVLARTVTGVGIKVEQVFQVQF